MPKQSKAGPGTPVGAQILDNFKNWKTTGFKPWGQGVGNVNHYWSCQMYQDVTLPAFCQQAKIIAKIALEQLPANEYKNNDGAGFLIDSNKNNPWKQISDKRSDNQCKSDPNAHPSLTQANQQSDKSDPDFESEESNKESSNCLDDFDRICPAELQNSFLALLSEYKCGKKLLAVFPLDGNIRDIQSNQFEFVDDGKAIL
mgnify:CR=1 FL=1